MKGKINVTKTPIILFLCTLALVNCSSEVETTFKNLHEIDVTNKDALKKLSKKNINELHIVNQAMMHLLGQGVKKDSIEAMRLFLISANQGNQYAQANAGLLYAEGEEGIEIDYEKAFYWLKKASEQGNAYAQASLGHLYENGLGVKVSFTEAHKLYKESAIQGNMLAHRKLGFVFETGKGVPIDLTQSFMWFVLAGSGGDEISQAKVHEFKTLLDKAQMKKAFNMVDKCMNSGFIDCAYITEPPNYKSLSFVCNYKYEDPLTLKIDDENLLIGSLDVKHELKILSRNNISIEWTDDSYMKLPFNVDHVLDLENRELIFTLGLHETKLDCLEVEEKEIDDYETDMELVVKEEGWSPRLPTLSFYLKMASNKDHPKVMHQMNLRCESLLFTKVRAILKSFCPDLEVDSVESKIKLCMGDANFFAWKLMTEDLLKHSNEHHKLNIDGGFLSERQLNSQTSVMIKAYDVSFKQFLNKKESENCWGNTNGLLCWEEEAQMCKKIREEGSMQEWFDRLTSSKDRIKK